VSKIKLGKTIEIENSCLLKTVESENPNKAKMPKFGFTVSTAFYW
jgi:hypothetical protein